MQSSPKKNQITLSNSDEKSQDCCNERKPKKAKTPIPTNTALIKSKRKRKSGYKTKPHKKHNRKKGYKTRKYKKHNRKSGYKTKPHKKHNRKSGYKTKSHKKFKPHSRISGYKTTQHKPHQNRQCQCLLKRTLCQCAKIELIQIIVDQQRFRACFSCKKNTTLQNYQAISLTCNHHPLPHINVPELHGFYTNVGYYIKAIISLNTGNVKIARYYAQAVVQSLQNCPQSTSNYHLSRTLNFTLYLSKIVLALPTPKLH